MQAISGQQALCARMHAIISEHADHIAVREHGRDVSYAEFGSMIERLYQELGNSDPGATRPVGLLLDRSAIAYASMWASIGLGRPYVPLNTSYPQSRLRNIIDQADIGSIICDEVTHDLARTLGIDGAELVVAAHSNFSAALPEMAWWQTRPGGNIAYVLFTSGSTGQPKGVPISYDNLLAFVDNLNNVIEYRQDDVCSQSCELSFDFSVHEIYLALLNGCTLCPARQIDLFNPAQFIDKQSITVWIAVPSLARVILNNGIPVGKSLHGIRVSIFNGEALTAGLAAAWHDAAPNAAIWNNYGPTECTVAVTAQRWSQDPDLAESGVVSIGKAFADCRAALLDNKTVIPLSSAVDGQAGELLLDSPQRFSGYTDPELPSPFVCDNNGNTYYRTGDRVRWRAGRLYHLGRVDYQVKIGGHRIELLEIEHRIRRFLETDSLAVIAHPPRQPVELVLFYEKPLAPPTLSAEELGLPKFMLPNRTVVVDALPTNAHGKLDRNALHDIAEAGQ